MFAGLELPVPVDLCGRSSGMNEFCTCSIEKNTDWAGMEDEY